MEDPTPKTFDDQELRAIAVRVAEILREHPGVEGGISVRATLSFLEISQAMRLLEGAVTLDSVYEAAFSSFGSRLKPRGWGDPEEIVREVLDEVLFGKKAQEGLRLQPQSEDEAQARTLRDLMRDLMTLSVAHKHGPNIKEEAKAGVFPKDLASLLRERYEEGRQSLPNLTGALMNAVRQAMRSGVFSPNKAVTNLLDGLENFNLMKKDGSVGEQDRYKFTKGAVNLVGEETARRILKEDYEDLVDQNSGEDIGENLSKEELSKLLNELQNMLDLLQSGRLASSMEMLMRFYGDQFPTLAKVLQKLSPMTSGSPNSWDSRFDHSEELSALLKILEREKFVETAEGFTLSTKAYELIFEDVLPEVEQALTWGDHESIRGGGGDGEVMDVRRYRTSDRFKDVAFGATMRQLAKHRRRQPESRDFRVNQKLPTKSLGIVLAIDSSRSMAPHGKLLYAKKAAVGLALAATRRGDRVGVLSFSDYANDVVDPAGDVDQGFIRRVAELRPLNSTNVEDALKMASRTLNRYELGQKHIILITDGVPTSCSELFKAYAYPPYRYYYGSYFRGMSIKAAYDQARRCLADEVTVSTICVDRDEHVDRDFCINLSRLGKGQHYFLKDERELPRTTLREYHRARNS
jgi:hypothetical protein